MIFSIEYFANDGRHITLKPDGSIKIYLESSIVLTMDSDPIKPIIINYDQAKILKNMILAEAELDGNK